MNDTERNFFSQIQEATFANPFGQTRLTIDLAATGLHTSAGTEEILQKLIHKVGKTLIAVKKRSRDGSVLTPEDSVLLRFGMLFHTFHLFCDSIDDHITQQIESGEKRCHVSFGPPLLGMLHSHGFTRRDSIRFLELFFQMRRAHYFIRRIIGSSPAVMNLRRILWNNVFTQDIQLYEEHLWNRMEDFSTMILGETGTGKGVAAGAIGRSGYIPYEEKNCVFAESFASTFTSINLSQYPEQLIESELFGHKKGSFTGAVDPHKGIFNRCSPYGSIFLDEIGDVSTHIQIKLLRVLQERVFSPVGSHTIQRFQGRVIGATNQSLEQARDEGRFRDDFYYRLCSDVIEVPPLRKRIEENPEELKELLTITVKRIIGTENSQLVDAIHHFIKENQPPHYPWPGNIRELEQCARRILLHGTYTWQSTRTRTDSMDSFMDHIRSGTLSAADILTRYCSYHYEKLGTYEAVAKLADLDRRTVKKYIENR